MPNDQDLLDALSKLLLGKKSRKHLRKTRLPLIIPTGTASGFALDAQRNVVGIKLSLRHTDTPQLLSLICQFRHLEKLVLSIDDDYEIPTSIRELKRLQFLMLQGSLKKFPPELLELNLPIFTRGVEVMRLREITSTPMMVDYVAKVEGEQKGQVRVSFTLFDLAEIKNHLAEIDAMKGIYIYGTDLEEPPLEIVSRGREAVKSYFKVLGTDALPLNELKVLLVGNGAAGKTSLVKQVFGESFNVEESQTHGINIRSRVVRTNDSKEIKLNFWDFGGQEIMHATHQFFLSKRSMYILVLDGRKEEDPEYWLQHIESFGGDSPVMIVLNKIDEHPSFDVNRRFLKSKYAGIVDFFRVSCATGMGISDLTTRLADELTHVSMLQTLWPGNWFSVKQRLENVGVAYVSLNEYRLICDEEDVKEAESQELLVDFLNDLGVVLHFRDMELLDTHVLDPRWVTEAVYRIINSQLLADQKGILQLNQLAEALKPGEAKESVYPEDKHRYIVDLMLKFELCYRVDNTAILVPDLLDIQEPAIVFEAPDLLQFVFEYSYLPKSIMPRFIVRMHKDIKGGARWRTGVLLEEKSFNAKALVRADEKDKRIYVAVSGKQKRDYFAVIRKVIHDLNSSFEKLGVAELVPLPDVPNHMLDYSDLLGHEQSQRDEIFVGRLGRGYNVQTLLDGIVRKTERVKQQTSLVVNHVQGDYFEHSNVQSTSRLVASQIENVETGRNMNYKPQSWEKIIVYITGLLFLSVISFLAIRNQPIADPNLVVLLRIVLSMVVAVFGATIPGMLRVDFSAKGLTIRSMGALALFVITYILTPKVL